MAAFALTGFLAACDRQEGPAEEAGEAIDRSTREAGDSMGKAMEKAGEKMEDAGEKMQH